MPSITTMETQMTKTKTKRTRVTTITCPQCKSEMYSRSRHDFHGCACGTFIDGGFDYIRYGWPNGYDRPKARYRYVNATRAELANDWNKAIDKYGFIK